MTNPMNWLVRDNPGAADFFGNLGMGLAAMSQGGQPLGTNRFAQAAPFFQSAMKAPQQARQQAMMAELMQYKMQEAKRQQEAMAGFDSMLSPRDDERTAAMMGGNGVPMGPTPQAAAAMSGAMGSRMNLPAGLSPEMARAMGPGPLATLMAAKGENGFTLSPGQVRYGGGGQQVAAVPASPANETFGQPVAMTGPGGRQVMTQVGSQGTIRPIEQFAPPADKDAEGKVFGRADKLRDEFNNLTKDFRVVQDAYSKINSTSDTGAGDMSMLYSYVKLLDPGSVVRESEFATAAASGSFGDTVQGAVNRLLTGERLPPNLRASFKSEAKSLYSAQKSGMERMKTNYADLAKRYGLRTEDVIQDYSEQYFPRPGDTQETIEQKRQTGLTPEETREYEELKKRFGLTPPIGQL